MENKSKRTIVIVIVVLILIFGCVLTSMLTHSKNSESNDSSETNTSVVDGSTDNSDDYQLIETPTTEQETLTSDSKSASYIIADYLNETGEYKVIKKSESQWERTDLSSLENQNPNFHNLYKYVSYGKFAKEKDDANGAHHRAYDYVYFTCYVTKGDDGIDQVHYISRVGEIIYDDGFMTDDLLKLANGDNAEDWGEDEQQSYDEG